MTGNWTSPNEYSCNENVTDFMSFSRNIKSEMIFSTWWDTKDTSSCNLYVSLVR